MKPKFYLLVVLLLAVAASACATATPPPPTAAPPPTQVPPTAVPPTAAPPPTAAMTEAAPYVIGSFFSITGPVSSLGQPEADTMKLLAEQVNAKGGIKGPDGKMHKVEVKILDDQSDATKAVEAVKKLIDEDKVPVIVGGSGSPASLAVIETVTKAGVPFISVASSSAIVNAKDGTQNKWVFKTPQQNKPVSEVQFDWLKAKGFTKVASLGVNNAFGNDSIAALKQLAQANNVTIVADEKFEPGATDFSAQLTKIAGTDAQALVVHATSGEGAPLTVQARDLLKIPLIHNHGIGSKAFIDTAKAAANDVLFPIGKLLVADQLPDSDPQKAILLQYQKDYTAKYGKGPSTFGGHAWDGFWMVIKAFEAVGPDSAKIRDYLENNVKNFVGISGIFNISAQDHTGIGKESLVLVEIVDGKWKYVDPKDYANVP